METTQEATVRLLASADNWIDGAVVRQLYAAAELEGVREVIGFPSVYPGSQFPVGTAIVSEGVLHPQLAGPDLGCGVGFWQTNLSAREVDLDEWSDIRFDLEHPWEGNIVRRLAKADLPANLAPHQLGSLSGGSHFAEVQLVERVYDRKCFASLGLERDHAFIVIHSGSGPVGESVYEEAMARDAAQGIYADSGDAANFLAAQELAIRWAKASRALLAERFATALGASPERVLDVTHNSITTSECNGEGTWLHRRGAAAADAGPVLIPGSRGALSYLVEAVDDGATTAASLPHGAGRKWLRSQSRQKARERFGAERLAETELGGRVVCEDRELLYEEAPMAFKNIERVVRDLLEAGLVRVIASLRPVFTYKLRAIRR